MAHLGFGLPAALALKARYPDRAVVNITGDGAFGFTMAELDTARRHGLAAVTVIHNNESWGVIRFGQGRGGFELGTALEGDRLRRGRARRSAATASGSSARRRSPRAGPRARVRPPRRRSTRASLRAASVAAALRCDGRR